MPETLASIRNRVLDDLKRDDVTRAADGSYTDFRRLDRWINDSIRRIQGLLKTPMTERVARAIVPDASTGRVVIPADLVGLINLFADGRILGQVSPTEVNAARRGAPGYPSIFYKQAGQYVLGPSPAAGVVIDIEYFGTLSELVLPTDTNILLEVAPDLVTLGALVAGGGWSYDPANQTRWADLFTTRFKELQEQADRDILNSAAISPCSSYDYGAND